MSQEPLQIYDWETYDEEVDIDDSNSESESDCDTPTISQNFVIYLYALTQKGENVSIKVNGFTPYFWIEIPNFGNHHGHLYLRMNSKSLYPRICEMNILRNILLNH